MTRFARQTNESGAHEQECCGFGNGGIRECLPSTVASSQNPSNTEFTEEPRSSRTFWPWRNRPLFAARENAWSACQLHGLQDKAPDVLVVDGSTSVPFR